MLDDTNLSVLRSKQPVYRVMKHGMWQSRVSRVCEENKQRSRDGFGI